jgi:hypothetical protein
MRQAGRSLEALVAGLLLAGIPIALWLFVGLPLHHDLHEGAPVVIGADLVWLTWAWCTIGVLVDVGRRVARRDLERGSRHAALDQLGIRLAALLLATMGLLSSSGLASGADAAAPAAAHAAATKGAASASGPATPIADEYIVQPGDCLWSIATARYGDGGRWVELAAANLGKVMDDGRLFIDPSLIYPGWRLIVPGAQPPALAPSPAAVARPLAELPATSPPSTASSPSASRSEVPVLSVTAAVASLGGSSLLLGLLRRRRRRLGRRGAGRDQGLVDAEITLSRVELLPATSLLERALLLAGADGALEATGLLELGERGAKIFVGGRERWHASPDELQAEQLIDRAPCAVIPLGGPMSSSWSLLIPEGNVGRIGGDGAEQLVEAALVLQQELGWGHLLVPWEVQDIDEGTLVIERGAEAKPGRALIDICSQEAAEVCVGDDQLLLRDLDLRLGAASPSSEVFELLELEPDDDSSEPASVELPIAGPVPPPVARVRLLTAAPRVEGLSSPIEPRRERRAIELIAYLALHRPAEVTGDRLRSRVLGGAEADAAAKTLFNVASAARRALGPGGDGSPLLPPASRRGEYRVADGVQTDLDELLSHLAAAEATDDDQLAIGHLRAGLELIDSEPLSNVLVGWEWFVAEGHRGRLEGAVERAAELLVDHCLVAGLAPLAQRCLSHAVMAVPYSETLAQAAMELAAALGDADELRRSFDAYGRLVEELDPGSWPLASAEQRFRALRAQIEEDQASLAAMDAAPLRTKPSAPAAL